MPSRIGRVLSLVRKLIDYGRELAGKLQHHATAPGFAVVARPFGTADLDVILARIMCGLRRAAALEDRLCQRAAGGRDLVTPSPRVRSVQGPGSVRRAVPPDPQPARSAEHPCLARLLTEADIASEVRRRPIGAVIADICRDLGIAPGHLDRAFWDEISHAIIAYGGSLVRFLLDLHNRLFAFGAGETADPAWPAALPRSPVSATRPP